MSHAPLSHLLKYCHLKPIANAASVRWDAEFSEPEYRRIMRGHNPWDQDDKWVMMSEGDDLYIYRAASGECGFVVHFCEIADGWRQVSAVDIAPFVQELDPLRLLFHLIRDILLQGESDR
jgi:hypothetical protein